MTTATRRVKAAAARLAYVIVRHYAWSVIFAGAAFPVITLWAVLDSQPAKNITGAASIAFVVASLVCMVREDYLRDPPTPPTDTSLPAEEVR